MGICVEAANAREANPFTIYFNGSQKGCRGTGNLYLLKNTYT